MRRRLVAVLTVLTVLGVTLAATQAMADTGFVDDPVDPVGPHDIRRLVVDNTGDRIGATVLHRGARWSGTVRLAFDVTADGRPEYLAVLRHGRPKRAVFSRAGGARWRCKSRVWSSPRSRARTRLSVARSCLAMAPTMRVSATASAPGRSSDSVTSGVVLQQRRPNVVMIMVDDMRDDDLAYMPWTRRLIGGEGVRFRNSFAPYPLCCPARASVLTGKYTHNHGVYQTGLPYGFTTFDDSSTLATWLRRAGYAPIYLGKYLNGYGWMPEPGRSSGKSLYYVPPGWSEWRASIDGGLARNHPKNGTTYRYFDTTLSANGNGFDGYPGQYQTEVYGALTDRIVRGRAASDQPFFLYVSYTAPHSGGPEEPDDPGVVVRSDGVRYEMGTPARPRWVKGLFDARITSAPGADWNDPDFTDKPAYLSRPALSNAELVAMRELARQRAESLAVVDRQVKRTVDALRASGELEETLVVFTSDNGYFLGEQRRPQGKKHAHDPSLRVPVLMRGPGIPRGQVRYDPFLSLDFAPTIADFTGARPGAQIDGTSMLGVARNGDRGWRRAVLTHAGRVPGAKGIRTDRYLYIRQAGGEEELYDMAEDPRQYHNLAGDPGSADLLALLRGELERMQACRGEACRTDMPASLTTAPGESVLR